MVQGGGTWEKCGGELQGEVQGRKRRWLLARLGLILTWQVHAFRVGGPGRWEFIIAGDVCRQVAEAEGHAAKIETVVSAEAWRCALHVHSMCTPCALHSLTLAPVPTLTPSLSHPLPPPSIQAGVRSLRGRA